MFKTSAGIIKPLVYIGIVNSNKLLLVKYKIPPNPTKTGWWIPAPGLDFGEDPQSKVIDCCKELGLNNPAPQLVDVESFVTPGGWHLIFHFAVRSTSRLQPTENMNDIKWVTLEELTNMTDIAHGHWEINIGKKFLEFISQAPEAQNVR